MKIPRLSFPLTVALLYGILGGLWIILSDQIAFTTIKDIGALSDIQTYKGWLFVLSSTLVLFFVLRRENRAGKNSETEARMAEERYRALVEQLPVAVYREAYGKENLHIYLSPQIEKILGYTLAELNAKPELWNTAIHPEDRAQVIRESKRTDQTLEPYQMEYRVTRKDGALIWLQDQAVVIYDENGLPQYWQGLLTDITERKKAQDALLKSEMSYRGLFNTVTDAIYIQDSDGTFLDVNEGAVKMYGYTREELIGKSPAYVAAPGKNDLEEVNQKIKLALEGEAQQFEFWGQRKNGEIFPKHVRVSKGSYFGRDVLIAFAEDITERKKSEEAIQKQLSELMMLHAVALTNSAASSVDELIARVTEIIDDTLRPDNCGVLLVEADRRFIRPHKSYRGNLVYAVTE